MRKKKLNLCSFHLSFFQDLIAKLVFKRPEKPIDFLVKEMEELKRKGTEKSQDDNTAY